MIHYDNPLHTTQNFWSGYIGYGKGSSYHVYWDEELKPSFWATKLPLGISHIIKKTKEHLDTNLEWIFLIMYPNPGFDRPDLSVEEPKDLHRSLGYWSACPFALYLLGIH